MARQAARLSGYSDVFLSELAVYRAALAQCWIPNPNTGELEFNGTLEVLACGRSRPTSSPSWAV